MRSLACIVVLLGCARATPPAEGIDAPVSVPAIDGPEAVPPSCEHIPATCGTGSSSCCDSSEVPGGTFYRSWDVAGDISLSVQAPATVSTFRLDKYEVTVGRFRQFVNAGMGTRATPPPPGAGAHGHQGGWDPAWNDQLATSTWNLGELLKCDENYQTWTDVPSGNENRPIDCIDWYEAFAFCVWDGGFLPTEAQWNYAAAGGSEQRAYPWSSPPASLLNDDSTYASYLVDDTKLCMGDNMTNCAVTDLVPVGSKPAGNGRWGHADLAGNVLEWTLDGFQPYATPCNDCSPMTGQNRVTRGGYFMSRTYNIRVVMRWEDPADYHDVFAGVRCARP